MSENATALTQKICFGVGLGLGIGMLSYYYYRYIKRDVMPQKWQRIGVLSKINLFPVKSCAPLQLSAETQVDCDILGARLHNVRDRGFMLVDEQNNMITARVYPKMLLINTEIIAESTLRFSKNDMPDIILDLSKIAADTPTIDVHTKVHDTLVDGMWCGEKYDQWFSEAILQQNKGMKLLYYAFPQPVRNVPPRMKTEPFITKQDTGTFSDTTSYMLINLASIADLNTRTKSTVNPLQFRANFEVTMDNPTPFAEDHWNWLKIGNDAIFRTVAPCTRCVLTNIDPTTGERNVDKEPLKPLMQYRKWAKYPSPVMGIHLGLRQHGKVQANDEVYIGVF